MQVEIKFIVSGACSAVGGFAPGDIARIDDKLAEHLVDEAKVAVYTSATNAVKPAAKTATKQAVKGKNHP